MEHTITHTEFSTEYFAGYEAAKADISDMGFAAARDKFNMDNPVGMHLSMSAYYYAKGFLNGLMDA